MTKPLSPAAAAVLRAAGDSKPGIYATITASLCAVADQLTPYSVAEFDGAAMARNRILAIAAEIEGADG